MLSCILVSGVAKAAGYETFDYNDVRQAGGFKVRALERVGKIIPAAPPLTLQEKEELVTSKSLKNLYALNLQAQEIDDEFVEKLSKNPCFSRLNRLDLSKNEKVTDQSLKYLRQGKIGSLRHLPQISGKYDICATEVKLIARNTAITDKSPHKEGFFLEEEFNFEIRYANPKTNKESSRIQGIKIIEVIL